MITWIYLSFFGLAVVLVFIGMVASEVKIRRRRERWDKALRDNQRNERRPNSGKGKYR